MNKAERAELETLMSAACDGPLSPTEQKRFDALLVEHPDACSDWLDCSRLHTEFGIYSRANAISQKVTARLQSKQLQPSAIRRVSRGLRRSSLLRVGAIATGLAASLLLAVLWPFGEVSPTRVASREVESPQQSQQPPQQTVKRRPNVVAVMRDESTKARSEDSGATPRVFLAGQEVTLTGGSASLDMTGGASLYLEGPARLKLEAADHVRLLSGKLSAHLSEWAKGFVVDTSAMRLIDLGTTFEITAEDDIAAAQVLQGLVRVQPREYADDDLRGFLLGEGESVRVDGPTTTRAQVDLRSEDIQNRIEAFSKLDSYKSITTYNTGVGLEEGEEDLYWRITRASVDSNVSLPRYAVVCKAHRRYSVNEPDRSQWISVERNNDLVPANSIYTFHTTIDLSGYDERSVRLMGQVLADNGVKEVRINGQAIDLKGWSDNQQGQSFRRNEFHVIEITEGFKSGINYIEFDVRNGIEIYKSQGRDVPRQVPNPMALRVEWQAFGKPLDSI